MSKNLTFFSILFLLVINSTASAQWFWQNQPLPVVEITQVKFINLNDGWYITAQGDLLRTTNGGLDWNYQKIADKKVLTIYFFDSIRGWATGEDFIAATTDGGNTWHKQSTPAISFTGDKIFFLNQNLGWIHSNQLGLIKTTNGGLSWSYSQQLSQTPVNDFCFLNEKKGWCVGSDGLCKTEDGGVTWVLSFTGAYTLDKNIKFIDSLTGWAAGNAGIFKTTTGGNVWFKISSFSFGPSSVFFLDAQNFYAALNTTPYLATSKSTDGGYTWVNSFSKMANSYQPLISICFTDTTTGFVAGKNGLLYKTIDGGANWVLLNKYSGSLTSVLFYDNSLGWAFGDKILFKTTDGGTNWKTIKTELQYTPNKMQFLDKNYGWAAYKINYPFTYNVVTSQISSTTNGGENWKELVSTNIGDFHLVNKTTGFFVGYGIYKTTDGGLNWVLKDPSSYYYNWVYFKDELNGMVQGVYHYESGYYGYFAKKTTDGGETWTTTDIGPQHPVYANKSNIWAVNASTGIMSFTSDFGINWTGLGQISGGGMPICFSDIYTGYSFDVSNNIQKTTNGGITWQTQTSPSTNRLNAVFFSDAAHGWIVGDNATILATTNGGVTFVANSKPASGINYHLKQNYPNPFNPETTIDYSISASAPVKLTVYNTLGQKIKTLVDEVKPKGNYSVHFNGSSLTSGIYYYELKTTDFTETKKFVLAK